MKIKSILCAALAALALLGTGCKAGKSTLMVNQVIAFGGATAALSQSPESRPYLAQATPLICAAAGNTNITPALLVEQINNTVPIENQIGPMIVNMGISLWLGYYNNNDPEQNQALQGVCNGFTMALALTSPSAPTSPNLLMSPKAQSQAWPQVRVK